LSLSDGDCSFELPNSTETNSQELAHRLIFCFKKSLAERLFLYETFKVLAVPFRARRGIL
jgi:hypothetical protein